MKKINSALILFVVICISTACSSHSDSNGGGSPGPSKPIVQNAHPGVGDIYVIGDDLAAGYMATELRFTPAGCLGGAYHQTALAKADLQKTSEDILDQVAIVEAGKPKLVFVSSGVYDALAEVQKAGAYPKEKTLLDVGKIFDRLLATKAVVVYLGLAPAVPGAERLPQVSALATSMGVIVVDGMNGLWGDPNYMSDDLHPNDRGYAKMCSRILSSVKEYYP